MRLMQANVRGLIPSKIRFIQDVILSFQLNIVCITESHLLDHIKNSFLAIPHFNLYRSDASGCVYKHGVCAYVHESLDVDMVESPLPNLLTFRLSSLNVHVVLVYRPPSNTPDMNSALLQQIYSACEGREVIVLGDFNLPALDWQPDGPLRTYPPLERSFLDTFNALGLNQWIHDPTFPSSGNILDLVFTSEDDRTGQIQILPPVPGSDHCPTVVEYIFSDLATLHAQDPHHQPRRAWHKGNYKKISSTLSETNWEAKFEGLSANECFQHLAVQIRSLSDKFVPLKPEVSEKPPWPSRPPTSLVHERQRAWSAFKSVRYRLGSRSAQSTSAYRAFADVNSRFRNYSIQSQSKYEEGLINKTKQNPKILHSYIRHKKVGRSAAGPLKLSTGALSDDAKLMSECFADAFASVYTRITPINPHPHQTFPGHLPPLVVSRDRTLSLLKGLDPNSSMGPDGLHPHLLKECAEAVATPLYLIYQKSLEEG